MHLLPNCPKTRISMDPSDKNHSSNKSQTGGNPPSESDPRSQPSVSPKSSWSPSVTMQYPPRNTMETVRDVLGRWRQNVGETTKMAEDLAENVWQHLKTGPSITDVAMGRLAQGTKVLAEGGYAKIFQQTFDTVPEEQLIRSFACYLSTSAGPVMGVSYRSTSKLTFCSDNPLPYKVGNQTEWSYYKVIFPFHEIRAVNSSANKENPAEKYIQVISPDNHEIWFVGFVNYEGAVTHLQEALQDCMLQAA